MNKKIIYADNAATTILSPKALEAMLPYLENLYANASQPYSFSRSAKKALHQARETIANCIGASPDEIYFTSGGSEGNNWVINGAQQFGTNIVTSSIEHHSIIRPAEYVKSFGADVTFIHTTRAGIVEPRILHDNLSHPLTLVSIMFANNEIGTIQKISELARLTHNKGGIFHTDAVQCVGHIDIDVKSLDIDILTASAHKFNGPKGIGFMYLKHGLKWPNLIYGGGQEFGLRAGTENIASIVGMAVALEENVANLGDNIIHCRNLEQSLLEKLDSLGVKYVRNGDISHVPGIISLSFPNFDGEMIMHRMDLKGIMISTGSACDSKNVQISHVLKAIHLDDSLARGTIRISLGRFNTLEDTHAIAEALSNILQQGQSVGENAPIDYSSTTDKTLKTRYLNEFKNFNISKMYLTAAPHKPVYMLTLIDAIRKGIIRNYRFQFTKELSDCFNRIWKEVVPPTSKYTPRITRPAFYLSSSSFYRLKNWEGKIAKEWQSPKSFATNYEYIELDKELFKLFKTDDEFTKESQEIFLGLLESSRDVEN